MDGATPPEIQSVGGSPWHRNLLRSLMLRGESLANGPPGKPYTFGDQLPHQKRFGFNSLARGDLTRNEIWNRGPPCARESAATSFLCMIEGALTRKEFGIVSMRLGSSEQRARPERYRIGVEVKASTDRPNHSHHLA
jgi:hypothetical protein